MAQITAALVKQLRDKTGAGMMDCKKALTETGGELEVAVDWLRKSGLAQAARKAGRTAAEGLVGLATAPGKAALVEINAETDFVARNADFQAVVREVATLALDCGGDLERLAAAPCPSTGRTVADEITNLIATIGENIQPAPDRRAAGLRTGRGHRPLRARRRWPTDLGRHRRSGRPWTPRRRRCRETGSALGKQTRHAYRGCEPSGVRLHGGSLDPALVRARAQAVLSEQARAERQARERSSRRWSKAGIRKYYQEVVLLEQAWFIDDDSKVKDGPGGRLPRMSALR